MSPGLRLALLSSILWAISPSRATAADAESVARARELYENGAVLYEEGNYAGAILAFQASYQLSNAPELNFNIANCYERLNQLVEARDALNLYRAVAPAEERERLERRVANLEARIAATPVAETSGAAAAVPVTTTPTAEPEAGGSAKWAVVGVGLGVAAGGGVLAGVEFGAASDAYAAGDRDGYDQARLLNGVGFGIAGAGVATAVVGLLLPAHPREPVSLAPVFSASGITLVASTRW